MTSLGEPELLTGPQPIVTRLRGWFFCAAMLFSALFGVVYVTFPLFFLIFFNARFLRKLLDRLIGIWVIMPGCLMTYIFGTTVKVRGDFIDCEQPALIIMNHRTRLDWLFFWSALYRMNPWLCTTEKITLKGVLKYLPGAGWAMQAVMYIFLDRDFKQDEEKLDKILTYFSEIGNKYQVLLFPEGTDKCPKATERSRLYAEKNGLVHYDYLLHPRTTGFVHIVQTMRKTNNIKFIYDVTIGFGDAIVQSEVDFAVQGVCPKEVYYQVQRIPIEVVPKDDEALAKWLVNLWADKEKKLKQFYSLPRNVRTFDNTRGGQEYEMDEQQKLFMKVIITFWTINTLFWMYMFFESALAFYYFFFVSAFFVIVQKVYGGFEFLTIKRFESDKRTGLALPVGTAPPQTPEST